MSNGRISVAKVNEIVEIDEIRVEVEFHQDSLIQDSAGL